MDPTSAKLVRTVLAVYSYPRDVGALRVTAEGLQEFAARCKELAGELSTVAAPSAPGPSWLATASAVGVSSARAAAAAETLSARIQATGAKIADAGCRYAHEDSGAATQLSMVEL